MKIGSLSISAMHKWLFVVCNIILLACIPTRVYSIGGYVNDPAITVPANAYTTFSMVYNGKRYYLGVDTIQAKAGKDTIAIYDEPCYAAMWIAGPMWSPTGAILPNKDYTRTVKSVWLNERITGRTKKEYLSVGPGKRSYALLVMTDEENATMWHTAKDFTVQSQYMHGFTYAYSDDGTETYRYLAYDPVYGFSRLYGDRPAVSQRISVWNRTTGDDVTATLLPSPYTFGLNQTQDTVKLPITTRVYYYTNVDRFRSRFDQMDIYVRTPTVVSDQAALVDPEGEYKLSGYYEWASNPRGAGAYNGHSLMPYYTDSINHHGSTNPETWTVDSYWADSAVLWVSDTKYALDAVANIWRDTIYAIGHSPFNVLRKTGEGAPAEGDYANHTDWLRQHFTIKGKNYVDSILITLRTFHNAPFTTLSMSATPEDFVFPYTNNDTIAGGVSIKDGEKYISGYIDTTFVISGKYRTGNDILHVDNSVASTSIGEERTLSIATRPCYHDTIWTTPIVNDNGDTTGWNYSDIILYDTLLVNAYLADGTTSAIGSDPSQWIESVELVGRNKIHVRVKQSSPSVLTNRIAQIRYTYRYRHSSAEGDAPEASHVIWISQKSYADDKAELYAFHHKGTDASGLQGVHERRDIVYAIPGEALPLHLHRDYWGYYRWFAYDKAHFDKDLAFGNNWRYVDYPKNHLNDDKKNGFMPINHTTDASSRGRWDIKKDVAGAGNTLFATDHFTTGKATDMPSIFYDASTTKRDTIACDVSAYYDVQTTPVGTAKIGQNLTSLTEPTLSYRQVFDVRPAKEQADAMSHCRVNGTGADNKWMETHSILVPAGRAFSLQQKHPVQYGAEDAFEPVDLQYIYYFNPDNILNNGDPDMGIKHADSLDTKATCYSRIGEVRQTGDVTRRANLLTIKDLKEMPTSGAGSSKQVIIVNARKGTGYVLGKRSGEETFLPGDLYSSTTVDQLKDAIENEYLNPGTQNAYVLTLTKTKDGVIKLSHAESPRGLWYYYDGWAATRRVRWITGTGGITGTDEINYSWEALSDGDRITGKDSALIRLYMEYWGAGAGGYLTGSDYQWRHWDWYHYVYDYTYTNNLHIGDADEEDEGSEANRRWLIYEIIEPDAEDHEEHPIWEKYNFSTKTWAKVAEKGTSSLDYTMLSDGSLRIGAGVHETPTDTFIYRLRTEHFQLAYFEGWVTNPVTDGPSATTILSEDSIQNHYEILYTLGNDLFPAPGTDDPTAYYHHMPWSFSELSYHYPVGTGDHEIASENRVSDNFLPERGEYAYINKFVEPGNTSNVVEAMAGAEHGYMMCINVSQKPVTIFNFEYPMIPCADQNIFLTVNLCNPVNNDYRPQITADLEGWNGSAWVPIYRYKTGEIPYNASQRWYQLVLPINQTYLAGFQKFRCIATMPGSDSEKAYVLIDRMRFIAKERPVNIFQNKSTCLDRSGSGIVDIIARLDYQNATYPAGTHFAFQYQKRNKSTGQYEPLKSSGVVAPDMAVKYTNDLADTLLLDVNGKGCGVITMPLPTYTPGERDTIVTMDRVTTHLKTYANEGTAGSPYYVMYISEPVYAQVGDTFRVAMTTISGRPGDRPDFAEAGCAMERLIPIHNPIEFHVNGSATEWTNYTIEQVTADPTKKVAANATYTVNAVIGDGFLPEGKKNGSGKCLFDVVRTTVADREFGADEAWFRKRFGCSRAQFRDIMTIFRADDDRNKMRLETNWNNVRPEMFQYSGRTKQQADSMYTILNRLIVDSAFIEIGLSSYDIYMGSDNNAYVVIWPIPATGTYEDNSTHEIKSISVCSTPQWFEIHSDAASTSLRFGYDNMFEGDYYLLPVVRASRADANSSIKVRLADITHTETTVAVMGWEATQLVETNDTTWHNAVFKYRQDKDVRTAAEGHIAVAAYYSKGDEVTFTPATGNTYTLKAGYWYRFSVPYYAASVGGDFAETTPVGHSDFVLAVAPDTVRWTPSHPDQTNYWNDDNNWTPVMAKQPADGFKARVPMNSTNVIIPQTEEGQLPVISDIVVNDQDKRDYAYTKNTCYQILFKPHAQMLGQEKLTYTKAFVDVPFTTGEWQTFSPALDSIYAGDMYIPFSKTYDHLAGTNGESIDTVDFAPKPFPYGALGSPLNYNPREYPFAFYQGFYNAAVHVPFYNTDTEDKELTNDTAKSKSTVDWVKTPSMRMHYAPGAPCIIQGFDATDLDGRPIVVRLPKSETTYYGYGQVAANSYRSGMTENLPTRPTEHNLAYDKYAATFNESTGISYTLKNLTPAEIFFFGNPTMALVDVWELCNDNSTMLKHADGSTTYEFTAYQLMDGSNYTTKTISGPGQYFIAPQRAIGLVANSVRNELTIRLKPDALVAITGEGITVNNIPAGAPKRKARTKSVYEEPEKRWLYVTASNETDYGKKKAYLTLGERTGASRGYLFGEDALSLSSGLNYYSDESYSTPLSLYTIADNQALMQDVRDTLVSVPLIFTTLPDYSYDEYTFLTFSMSGTWDKPLYLYDALNNDSVLIRNGLQVAIPTPNSDQIRYFINGAPKAKGEGTNGEGVTTGVEEVTANGEGLEANGAVIYDMLGRRVLTLNEFDLISNIQLPTGVYIIQRGTKTERMVIR